MRIAHIIQLGKRERFVLVCILSAYQAHYENSIACNNRIIAAAGGHRQTRVRNYGGTARV